ncbi:MAG: PSD1 and planctomycete cytochrome C domain-containing protein [Pirellulales bacterium]
MLMRTVGCLALVVAHCLAGAGMAQVAIDSPNLVSIDFQSQVLPILREHCFRCHGDESTEGGLILHSRESVIHGGDSGPAIEPGRAAESLLLRRVEGLDVEPMPPEGERLSAEQVATLRRWIEQGAVWPESAETHAAQPVAADHWSFQPIVRPPVPATDRPDWVRSPIDAFVLAQQASRQLVPAEAARRESLLRRIHFDLTGLPPTPADVAEFCDPGSTMTVEELVDRLLQTRAYAERWARHWLDIVRYADSGGYETDIFYEQAWRYRDYVIRSLEQNKPIDQFFLEQIAGDELWPHQAEAMREATAVWTLGEWPNSLDLFPEQLEYTRRTDQVITFSESMLGLTIGCANCHHHKFDPISQRDYFGLEAIFAASETWDVLRDKKGWGQGEWSHFRILRHAAAPTPIHLLVRGELTKPKGTVSPSVPASLPGGGPHRFADVPPNRWRAELAKWVVAPENPLTARVFVNRVWQWHFGTALVTTPNDFGHHGAVPSNLQLLNWLAADFVEHGWDLKRLHRQLVCSSTYQQAAQRTPESARIDPQQHYLAGFPSRRLEAEELWDAMLSVSGRLNPASFGPPVTPKLTNEELQGLFELEGKKERKWPVSTDPNRRAIYILSRRSFRFPFFDAFDPASNAVSCPQRQSTTLPTQALSLLNSRIAGEQADAMAGRLERIGESDRDASIRTAWLLAYSREITEPELKLAREFLDEAESSARANMQDGKTDDVDRKARHAALKEFSLAILNSAEFVTVD